MRILIADDHALFRDGLSMQLEKIAPDAAILQTGTYSQTIKMLDSEPGIDLVLLDLTMPDMDWKEGFDELKKHSKTARFIIVSASEDVRDIKKALEKGAVGYIPKRTDTKILVSALRLVIDGGNYVPPSLFEVEHGAENEEGAPGSKRLTSRQAQVLKLIAEGKSNKQIAFEIKVSEATVKLHINALLRALGATNRTQAVIIAQKQGLI